MENPPQLTARELKPLQKVAVLLASMDEDVSASILKNLEPDVMLKVAETMKTLGVVQGQTREYVIEECYSSMREMGEAMQGDESIANNLLIKALGEQRAYELMNPKPEEKRSAFANLSKMNADQLAAILIREAPNVIALVLRYAPSGLSADVVTQLPEDVRRKVVVFMCIANDPSEEIVTRVEAYLNEKINAVTKSKKLVDIDNIDLVASIIQHMPHSMEEDMLSAIEEKSEFIAMDVRDRLFTFEDIIGLSDQALRRLLQEVDMGTLAIALRNARRELAEKFFHNMSKRAAEGLREDMSFSSKIRVSEVDAKQREVVNAVRQLAADGEITISLDDDYV